MKSIKQEIPPLLQLKFKHLEMAPEESLTAFKRTLGQSMVKEWKEIRSVRISASKAHSIGHGRTPESRWNHFHSIPPAHLFSLNYGKSMENKAKSKYEEVTGVKVISSGVIVSTSVPYLCATTDGFAFVDNEWVCVEVKCPSRCCNQKIDVEHLDDWKFEN